MPLTSGTKIGPYEVASLLGVGGMGEVYRSRDSKLGREVAVKVLAAAVAGDPDRLARFGREAKVLAALNHPNIAAIYGLEDSGATHALVIQLRSPYTSYDAAPDGQHFAAFQFPDDRPVASPEPTVVLNWLDEVRRQVASGQSGASK
jgi:serine/threonine protein kinase